MFLVYTLLKKVRNNLILDNVVRTMTYSICSGVVYGGLTIFIAYLVSLSGSNVLQVICFFIFFKSYSQEKTIKVMSVKHKRSREYVL